MYFLRSVSLFFEGETIMSEILFVLTVIFVAYVFYGIAHDSKAIVKSATPTQDTDIPIVTVLENPSTPPSLPDKKQPKTTKAKLKTPQKTTSSKQSSPKKGLKNPKTGEITTSYTNYIFTKRWIKEALVAEKLLEKVYKNNELNAETELAIKAAIAKLEAMEQYKV
jgi:hypothetical protein